MHNAIFLLRSCVATCSKRRVVIWKIWENRNRLPMWNPVVLSTSTPLDAAYIQSIDDEYSFPKSATALAQTLQDNMQSNVCEPVFISIFILTRQTLTNEGFSKFCVGFEEQPWRFQHPTLSKPLPFITQCQRMKRVKMGTKLTKRPWKNRQKR